ncbi:GNAT family N-acetyltransferase [Fluviispira multicolorata]|uniref:GNAT family N-acetyltransferase n=1 Tax=Fluviispira multicolorata TaxID=2654512 RepID=A0A833N4Q7_9BACT|nr:GNAT family N-acetyltransferase [Fluviispira multicolorata]KAB8031056.1 GNAT family N-acetyltransferase [Fluviispira multicolorata]
MQNSDVFPEIVRDKDFSFQELQYLTNLCFESSDYLNNFPQVFKKENKEYFFLFRHNGQAVSFCTLYPIRFQLQNIVLNSYCIGSVCTHPHFRKKGFAKRVLLQAENKARENLVDFLFLFSDINPLYTELNYLPAGKTYLTQLHSKVTNPIYLKNLKRLNIEYLKAINKIDLKNTDFFYFNNLSALSEAEKIKIWQFIVFYSPKGESILSYIEFSDILKIKNMQMYLLNFETRLYSVCFINKGDDFQNVIHSIYYKEINFIVILLNKILAKSKDEELIFFPGVHAHYFSELFDFQEIPSLFLKSIHEKKITTQKLQALCLNNDIFISSLQGT